MDDASLELDRIRLETRGRRCEQATLGWNVKGVIVLAYAALVARSRGAGRYRGGQSD